jgi:putative hemolysin
MSAVWSSLLLALVTLLGSVLSAMVERSGPVRLRHWVQEANGGLKTLYAEPDRFEAFRFLLSFVAKAAPAGLALTLWNVVEAFGVPAPIPIAAALVAVLLVAVELGNRQLVRRVPEEVLRRLTPAYRAALLLSRPLLPLIGSLMPGAEVQRREEEDEEELSDEEIDAYIDFGAREGILEPDEEELLRGLVDFGDTQVKSVMTPRIDVTCTPIDAAPDDLRTLFLESGHSRIPMYEGSIDRVVGILHIRDLLRTLGPPPRSSARDLAKPPFFVPETKPLGDLLKEMQAAHQQMAIVVDEYGGTSGLVTVEDLLEEIVGEIIDEHEAEPAEVALLPDGSWRLDGRVHLETLEELFEIDLEDFPAETVGGLVFATLGYVPEVGDSIDLPGLRVWVESLDDRRIQTVRVERVEDPRQDSPATPEEAGEG